MEIVAIAKKQKNKKIHKIYIALRDKTPEVTISTDIEVDPKYWVRQAETVSNKHEFYQRIDIRIKRAKQKVDDVLLYFEQRGEVFSKHDVKRRYRLLEKGTAFYQYAQAELDKDQSLSESTRRQYQYAILHFKKFAGNLPTSAVTNQVIKEFYYYLSQRMKPNSSASYMRAMRKYTKRAVGDDLLSKNPMKKLKLITEEGERDFLDREELLQWIILFKSRTLPKSLQKTLGFYIMTCYTGIPHDDWKHKERLKILPSRIEYIRKKVKHTGRRLIIPIVEEAQFLVMFVQGNTIQQNNQGCNKNLNKICKLTGLNKYITFHTGRITFATMATLLGIDHRVIQEILGHAEYKTTLRYIKMAGLYNEQQMKKFKVQG